MLRSLRNIPAETFACDWNAYDKIVLVTVSGTDDRYCVAAREFDCTTRRWGTVVNREAHQSHRLAQSLFDTWLSAFAPLAQVAGSQEGVATLQLWAAALVPKHSGFQQGTRGMVFQPIVCRNGRDGTPQADGIQPIPWTYLVTAEADIDRLSCQVYSGVRNPLSIRRRGRVELFALAVRGSQQATELQLRSRRDA